MSATIDSEEIDTTTIRAALVALRIVGGERWTPTTAQVAQYARLSHSGAYRMLARLSGALSIAQDADGRWICTD